MANYETVVMTQLGLDLYTKAQTGIQLNFTRMQIGSGQLGAQDPTQLTALITPISFFAINSVTSSGNTAHVKGIFENSDIAVPTYQCELGLFALDPTLGEILYAYANAGAQGDTIPAISSGPLAKQFQLNPALGNAINVTATIPSTVYIPSDEKGAPNGVATLDANGQVVAVTGLNNASVTKIKATFIDIDTRSTTTTYDGNNKLSIIVEKDGATTVKSTTYTYNAATGKLETKAVTAGGSTSTTTYAYDADGRYAGKTKAVT